MGSSLENTITNFAKDCSVGSASSLITENTEDGTQTQTLELAGSATQSYQVQTMGIPVSTDLNIPVMGSMEIGNEGNQDQNMKITGIADHGHQTQNVGTNQGDQVLNTSKELSDHIRDYSKAKSEVASLQKAYDDVCKECDTIMENFTQLTSTYAAANLTTVQIAEERRILEQKCESIKQEEIECMEVLKNQDELLETLNLKHQTQAQQIIQYQALVEKLLAEQAMLKKNSREGKRNAKDTHKAIAALASSYKSSEDNLCSLGCVIEGRKQPDKKTASLIKKYCKKTISGSKKSMETTEDFEMDSVDTDRASSSAFSDGEGSLHSTDLSVCSFSSGSTRPWAERTKMMRNVASSPIPCPTQDISPNTDISKEDVTLPSTSSSNM